MSAVHPAQGRRVAVVGSGVAGLTAAYVLSRTCHVTLLEADSRLGGHADTHAVDVRRPDGSTVTVPVDTGFIVHNERTYPNLLRLYGELGITTRLSEMSMSIRDEPRTVEWAGALGLGGVFATWRNALDPAFLRMLVQIPRFHRQARALLRATSDADSDLRTLEEFLDDGGFDEHFRALFMEPLVAAVWSTDDSHALEYPARYLFRFLAHHGMLQVFGSPPWRTVVGGSATYVAAVAEHLDEVRTGVKVTGVAETADGVQVTDGNGERTTYDAVVVATHPHQALAMLDEPTPAQRELLGAITYSSNTAQLHTDDSLLPRLPRARASWNYLRRAEGATTDATAADAVTVTYDLTRLMRLDEAYGVTDRRFLVTLGGSDLVDPATVIDTMEYEHPLYTPESVAAQARLDECDSVRLVFAGAYHGWGFHEDGARSGVEAAARLGVEWERSATRPRPATPSTSPRTYATTIRHTRRTPWRRSFAHRSHTWVVDLDHLPRRGVLGPALGTFDARDHLNDPAHPERGIRENVEAFCAQQGVDVAGGRIVMAANPRAFGYCFNPISVFWCFGPDGDQRAVVVEVHNTYGERHAYLVHPDAQGRASTDKQLYVSPFHGTTGRYEIAVPTPTETDLHVAVSLTSPEGEDFSATLTGTAEPVAPWRVAGVTLRHSVLIRVHGIALWLRRLPVRPRPDHPRQEGVS